MRMKELIRISNHTIGNKEINACSARELHDFLQVGRDFSNWIKDRIEQYGYKKQRDYEVAEVFAKFGENQSGQLGGRPRKEYFISINMAKELAMVECNAMGRLARNYFIKCEEAATTIMPFMAEELLAANPMWRNIKRYKDMGLTHVEITKLLDCSKDTVRSHVRRMERCGIIEPPANLARMQQIAHAVFLDNRQMSLFPVDEKFNAEVQ